MKKIIQSALMAFGIFVVAPNLSAQTINVYPYNQDFDSWSSCGGSCTSTCALEDFWVNGPSATRDFSVDANGTSSSPTGPAVDHTTGTSSGNYLYAESSSPCSGTVSWHLISPPIDLAGTNAIEFSFWYHMYGQSMGTAHVDVSSDNGATWTQDVIPSWTDDQDLWQQKVVSLGSFSGTVLVRIRYEDPSNFYGDMAIDDVSIYDVLVNDAGVTAFVNPLIPTCNFNDTVTVELTNFGTDTLTAVSLNWQYNTTVQTSVFWTGALATGESVNVFLGTAPYTGGDDLKAWSSNPNGIIEIPSGAGNDTSEIIGLLTGLNGIYTIGGVAPDFPDVLSAVAALNFAGVCGPTTFNLRTGTYFDQFDLGQVVGADSANTITFRSEAGHRDSVIIDYGAAGSANNYVVLMNDADYFRFEQMTLRNSGATYGRVLDIDGGSDHNIFYDCAFITQANSSTSTLSCIVYSGNGSNDEYNRFENSSFIGGSYAAYWYGSSTTSLERGSEFINNEFEDNYYTGLRLYYQEAPLATKNRFFGNSTYTSRYGLYAGYCDKGAIITFNSIESNATSYWYYGLYAYYCDGTASEKGLIANNSVTTGNAGYTGTSYSMYVYYSGYFDIFNNSVNIPGGNTTSRAFYLYNGGANTVKNNTFTNFGDGYAAYIYGTYSVSDMDYNNYYSNGSNLGYFGSINTATFADWQNESGFDVNSLNVDPGYYSDHDLHVCADSLNNAGTPLTLIANDIDGQARDASTPDIGSDEFAPLGLPGFLGPDALVCTGETTNLYAGAPSDNVLWSTGDTTSMLVVTTPGTYTVSVIGTCGIAFDTIVVSASAITYTDYLEADTMAFCTGGSALLTSSMVAATYSWTGGSSNDSLLVTTGGTYTLNITDACGSGTESVVITENSVPVAGFTNTTSFVTGIFTNTTTGGGNPIYTWDFGDGSTSSDTDPIYTYNSVGTFYVTLTVTNDCGTSTFGDSITVSTLGLEEVSSDFNVNLFPNPSNGEFTIGMNLT
ncbi:MAG: PKD domain-containing protein, partial [Bacteroidota bacterium]